MERAGHCAVRTYLTDWVIVLLYVVVPDRPSPPNFGKITHHNIELIWDSDGEVDTMSIDSATPADMRRSACVQSQDKNGGWSNIYTYVLGSYSL